MSLARSNTVITPRATISEVVDEEWMIVEADFRRLYQLAGDPQAGSVELAEAVLRRLEREMGSGAVTSLSSPFGQPPAERQFWLVLNTELIIYGATEPTASLTVDGQPVPLTRRLLYFKDGLTGRAEKDSCHRPFPRRERRNHHYARSNQRNLLNFPPMGMSA